MVKNILLTVEYIGKNYFGFQIQNKRAKPEPTVQAVIERALAKLFGDFIRITYSSRTDRGVHAYEQKVNFTVDTKIPLQNMGAALGRYLPSDIRIKKAQYVSRDFHARYRARSKVYRYTILNKATPSVFWNDFAWYIPEHLDVEKMEKISIKIKGKRDFSLFAKEAAQYASCVRSVKGISFKRRGSLIHIDIEADGFLRSMARNIVSFIIAVGSGRLSLKEARQTLQGKGSYVPKPAPPQGLYLYKVIY